MSRIHANNFLTSLSTGITSGSLTIVLTNATGFPAIGAGIVSYLTLQNGAAIEIVKATAIVGTTVTIERAQEDTTALAFIAGTTVSIRPTKGSVDSKADLDSPTFTGTVVLPSTTSIGSVSATELSYLDGVTSSIQTQINALSSGSVASVSGTLNRVTSTGGSTPVIDISASYVGQSSITTLGTIGTGIWQGTLVGPTYGGTGINNGSNTITLGGNLIISGAFSSTFTMTNTTSVTFPTSGTLATTSQLPSGAALTKTDDTNVTLTLGGSASTSLLNAASLTLGWTGQLSVARGGTGVGSVTTSPTASAFAGWDANSNLSTNNLLNGYSTTATAAGTTTLTVSSAGIQFFTGTSTQTVKLPVASTLSLGFPFVVVNNSTGSVTVQSSGSNTISTLLSGQQGTFRCILTSGTTAASWSAIVSYSSNGNVIGPASSTDKALVIYNGTSGTSVQDSSITIPSANTLSLLSALKDTGGNQSLGFTATASAVNYINITNSATGTDPNIGPAGTDTNRALVLQGKGNKGVIVGGTGAKKLTVDAIDIWVGTQSVSTNTGIGTQTLQATNNATASNNTAIGYLAGTAITTGGNNTCLGANAGDNIAGSTGTDNTAIGYNSLHGITGGQYNTAVGSGSGVSGATGGVTLITATDNTLIGRRATCDTNSSVGCIAIGEDAVATKSTGSTSGTNGPGIAIGSASMPVGFRGDGSIFPGNLWRVRVNGTQYMIPLAADGSTALPAANGGTGVTSLGTGVATALGSSVTGSGGIVLSVSPTIQSPAIVDTNSNALLSFTTVASAVNGITIANNVTTGSPSLMATGTDTNITLFLKGKGNKGAAVQGSTSGSIPSSGNVGFCSSSLIASGSAVSLTTATSTDITSIALTAGNWLVFGSVSFTGGSTTTVTYLEGGIGQTTATLPATDLLAGNAWSPTSTVFASNDVYFTVPAQYINTSGTPTIYLVANASFATSTCSAYGSLYAIRLP